MVREIITLGVGQGGIQLSQTVWKQYGIEHGIDYNGKYNTQNSNKNASTNIFYQETKDGQFLPRSMYIDSDTNTINNVMNSQLSNLFQPDHLLSGKHSAGNNFASGYHRVGKEMIDTFENQLRKLLDNCDNIQGFLINHSVSGGTGSGFGCLLLEKLDTLLPKKRRVN